MKNPGASRGKEGKDSFTELVQCQGLNMHHLIDPIKTLFAVFSSLPPFNGQVVPLA